MSFNERLKEARIAKGLTQKQFAEKLGLAGTTVTGYEKGNSEPNVNTIGKMMDILQVDANFLWQDEMNAAGGFPSNLEYEELEHIKKYRALDEHGKKLVDTMLDIEYTRLTDPIMAIARENNAKEEFEIRYSREFFSNRSLYNDGAKWFDSFSKCTLKFKPPYGVSYMIEVPYDIPELGIESEDILLIEATDDITPKDIGLFVGKYNFHLAYLRNSPVFSVEHPVVFYPESYYDASTYQCIGKVRGKCTLSDIAKISVNNAY